MNVAQTNTMIKNSIDTEINALKLNQTKLQTNITAETATRAQQDNVLQFHIDAINEKPR